MLSYGYLMPADCHAEKACPLHILNLPDMYATLQSDPAVHFVTLQVAAGVGHIMFLVDSESEIVKKLSEFTPETDVEPSKGEKEAVAEATGKGGLSKGQD